MAQCEEVVIDLATVTSPNSTVAVVQAGREFSDVYINELPPGAPAVLVVGLTSSAGFKNLRTGDSFDCTDRLTCRGELGGLGVQVTALTVGTLRLLVSFGPGDGGAAGR